MTSHQKHSSFTLVALLGFSLALISANASAKNLEVPFTSQAPLGDWRQPWQDACEETSLLMTDAYYQGYSYSPHEAKEKILNFFEIKERYYGESLDEDAAQNISFINQFLPWEAYSKENPTIEEIKEQIQAGHPVILPASGVELRNPHFVIAPNYHMVVISGYDDEKNSFITQEPGTRFGKNFLYSYTRTIEAMHDFLPHYKTPEGKKLAIFTRPFLTDLSAKTDGDKDGLSKEDELAAGTSLTDMDTDDDGFSDWVEVTLGYSPLLNEYALSTGSLIKTKNDPKVYILENNAKKHITSENAFVKRGFNWTDIVSVSERFIEFLPEGQSLY